MLAAQRVERLAAVLGLVDREVERFQDVTGDLADHLAVVDDQAAAHFIRSSGRRRHANRQEVKEV